MNYIHAQEKYAKLGIDTDAAIAKLKTVPVSLHCWQGDDVRGFDTDPNKPLTGGIQTTGNYPGRARTPAELMADIDQVLKLCPGTKKLNLHASYAIFEDGEWADRDKLEPKHFQKWVNFCKERGLGCDFNPTFFSQIRTVILIPCVSELWFFLFALKGRKSWIFRTKCDRKPSQVVFPARLSCCLFGLGVGCFRWDYVFRWDRCAFAFPLS